jgi:phage tail sheath protein FI
MSMNLGINVVEVDGATPSIQGAPTSVAGFVIRSERGVPGVVRQITNFTQFTDFFGGYVAVGNSGGTQTTFVGAYAIRGFFDNGGTQAFVLRVVDQSDASLAKAASASFPAATGSAPVLIATAGFRGQTDPGIWGKNIAVLIEANTSNTSATGAKNAFDLTVARVSSTAAGQTFTVLETWTKLSYGGEQGYQKPDVINDPNTGSKYITVQVVLASAGAAPVVPAPTTHTVGSDTVRAYVPLTNGAEDGLVDAALNTALTEVFATPSPFDPHPIELVACPESSDPGVVQAALSYCIGRGDCMFVGHVPEDLGPAEAKGYGQQFQKDKVYGALYQPFIKVVDPIGTVIWIPPTGHVLGVYARTDQLRGIWKAPAGNTAAVNNAIDVRSTVNDIEHTDLVKNGSVNSIRPITGAGIVIDSSRTLSTNTLWLYVNVRLLFNFVKTSLKLGLRWVVQEPNDTSLWNKIKFNSVTPFLMGLWRRGAFGPGAPADVFTVKVDEENNPPANIQQGILNVDVFFFPSRPAETIVITVGQQEGGAKSSES